MPGKQFRVGTARRRGSPEIDRAGQSNCSVTWARYPMIWRLRTASSAAIMGDNNGRRANAPEIGPVRSGSPRKGTHVRALTCILSFIPRVSGVHRTRDCAGRAPVEGVLDRHVGAESEPQQRRDHHHELGRQGDHGNHQSRLPTRSRSRTRRSIPKAGSCTSRATRRTSRGRRSRTSSTARSRICRRRDRTVVGTWKTATENGPFKISRQ